MASYPDSTAATDGSATDFPPLPTTSTSSSTTTTEAATFASMLAAINAASNPPHAQASIPSSSSNTLKLQHIASWLNNAVEGHPRFTYTSDAIIDAHIKDIKECLNTFDDVMAKK
ncbi:uncharacterized protein LY89DRAFT_670883 [Mollisia scopiformis]|uniref:Uncharacterized protein n=1 Tax=Mollisia scopiformis TaxID=149040 RepID=A0A194X5Q7_MOLSC|nr:uncharacterized protein LY89DRAFT_670883 [Mollisia scopiformis]KUJ15409.1 hypothetical protein LY89DRAFT_670883 [Mollisia scopiformis]